MLSHRMTTLFLSPCLAPPLSPPHLCVPSLGALLSFLWGFVPTTVMLRPPLPATITPACTFLLDRFCSTPSARHPYSLPVALYSLRTAPTNPEISSLPAQLLPPHAPASHPPPFCFHLEAEGILGHVMRQGGTSQNSKKPDPGKMDPAKF